MRKTLGCEIYFSISGSERRSSNTLCVEIYFPTVQKYVSHLDGCIYISQLDTNLFLNCVEMYFSISGSERRSGCTKHNSFPTFSSPSFLAAPPIILDLVEVRLPDQTNLTSHLFFFLRLSAFLSHF